MANKRYKDCYKVNPIPEVMGDEEFFKYQSMGLFDDKVIRNIIIKREYKEIKSKTDKNYLEIYEELAQRWFIGFSMVSKIVQLENIFDVSREPVYETLPKLKNINV